MMGFGSGDFDVHSGVLGGGCGYLVSFGTNFQFSSSVVQLSFGGRLCQLSGILTEK